MTLNCPKCSSDIPLADVNVATDIALCRRCGNKFSFAELSSERETPIDLTRPPKGAWFKQDSRGFEVGVSTRHPSAFFLVPFMCVWSGFSLGGIYGSQITKGKFNLGMSLFGIPFILGTLLFGSIAVMSVCGKIIVRVVNDQGTLFTGVGPIGWRRKFKWNEVKTIRLTEQYGKNGPSERLTMDADRSIHFATGINEVRREFMLAALRLMRRERK